MFTEKSVSASMNVIIIASGSATLCMPGPDSDFSDFIKDNLVEFSVSLTVQNPCFIVSEFT